MAHFIGWAIITAIIGIPAAHRLAHINPISHVTEAWEYAIGGFVSAQVFVVFLIGARLFLV